MEPAPEKLVEPLGVAREPIRPVGLAEQFASLVGTASVLVRRAGVAAALAEAVLVVWAFVCLLVGGIFVGVLADLRIGCLAIPVIVLLPLLPGWCLANVFVGPLAAFTLAAAGKPVTFRSVRELCRAKRRALTGCFTGLAAYALVGWIVSVVALSSPYRSDRWPEPLLVALVPISALALGIAFVVVRGVYALGAIMRNDTTVVVAVFDAEWRGRRHRWLPALALVGLVLPIVAASSPGFAELDLSRPLREIAVFLGVLAGSLVGVYLFGLVTIAAHVVASGESLE